MTIKQVTEYLLMKAAYDMDVKLSSRKLSRMVYMAQAHSYAMRNIPIVDCTFVAEKLGPNHWDVDFHYRKLKKNRDEKDAFKKRVGSVMRGKSPANAFKITEQESSILDDVYEEFKDTKVTCLEEKLREPGTPWSDVYQEGKEVLIPNELIRLHYSRPENRIKTIEEKAAVREDQERYLKIIMNEQRSVLDVSKWFVARAIEDKKPLGIYKLMCMCYYAQGQTIKELGHTLFCEPIRKRENGPYIAQVNQVYKKRLSDDLDTTIPIKVPSIAKYHLAVGEMPISLNDIYVKYIDMPTRLAVTQALEEIPFAIPNDCEVIDSYMRMEFEDRDENHD